MYARSTQRVLLHGFSAVLIAVSVSAQAHAYCFASTCGEEVPICDPPVGEPCGHAKRWKRDCIGYALQRDGTTSLSVDETTEAVRAAFNAWTLAPCDTGEYPGIDVIDMGDVACNRHEFNEDAGNANVVTFFDTGWPYPERSDALALTWVSFTPSTGEILNSDIEVNTANFTFAVDGTSKEYDLVGVLTHEAGHVFGMAHSLDADSTMHGDALPGDTGLRTLTPDDVAGICALYPSKTIDYSTCNPIPVHGFASECRADQYKGSCGSSGVHSTPRVSWAIAASVLGALMWMRRTRLRPRPRRST